MLPEFKIKMRPNNQIVLTLQNIAKKNVGVYQDRYFDNSHYDYENDEEIKTFVPTRNQRQKNLLLDKIADQKRRSQKNGKCKSNTKLRFDISKPSAALDIIQKTQRSLKMSLLLPLRFITFRKILWALVFFSQYRVGSPKKFGNVAGQKIRECGAVIDILCKGEPHKARVVTLTLPANHASAFECLAARSGYIINRLFQPIRRHFPEIAYWFFVWEHQKRGALHLHICIFCGEREKSLEAGEILIKTWIETLKDISEESGICMFANSAQNACVLPKFWQNLNQEMHKSCGGYFSKYAGKSANCEENSYVRELAKKYPPTRFWGSSKKVKSLVAENSYDFSETSLPSDSLAKLEQIQEIILENGVVSFCEYQWDIGIKIPDTHGNSGRRKIGTGKRLCISEGHSLVFYVSPPAYEKLLQSIKCAVKGFEVF